MAVISKDAKTVQFNHISLKVRKIRLRNTHTHTHTLHHFTKCAICVSLNNNYEASNYYIVFAVKYRSFADKRQP